MDTEQNETAVTTGGEGSPPPLPDAPAGEKARPAKTNDFTQGSVWKVIVRMAAPNW